jgi:hypothetical protein
MHDDEFVAVFGEVEAMLRSARSDQVAEALRLLASEVAYLERYREQPSLEELTARINEAGEDPASMALVVGGLRHLVEVLTRLRVPKVEDVGRAPAAEEAAASDVDWFGKGWAVYKGDMRDAAYFPPLNDMEAQRWWLGGFGAGWVEDLNDAAVASVLLGEGMAGESVEEALARVCEGRAELLRQLRSHRDGWGTRTVQ